MSITKVPYPIAAALLKAGKMEGMGPQLNWQPVNSTQRDFLPPYLWGVQHEIGRIPEIESLASWNAGEINAFLRKRGFTIQLQPFDSLTFGVASVLDVLVEWLTKGEATTLKDDVGRVYPAVRIGKGGVRFHKLYERSEPIAQLETKTGDRVFMTKFQQWELPKYGEFTLVEMASSYTNRLIETTDFGGLVFPMVDLDQEVDISWLLGMHAIGKDKRPATISQARQQTIFKMNEVGARARSAAAIAVTKGFARSKPDLVIDQPFLVWIVRSGLDHPLFVGYITQEDWKNPGDISK